MKEIGDQRLKECKTRKNKYIIKYINNLKIDN